MAAVFSDEELSTDARNGIFKFLNSRSWVFRTRRISHVRPMGPEDFLHLLCCRLNYSRQSSMPHHKVSYHLLKLFEWYLEVMVHHGVHVGIISILLAESRLVIALRRYEHWVGINRTELSRFHGDWIFIKLVARRIRRRLLRMSRENSRAVEGE